MSSLKTNQEPSNVNAHDANFVPLFLKQIRSQGPITDHFTCISVNVTYFITCTLCQKIYIGETETEKIGRLLSRTTTRCRKNDRYAPKPVARHFNLPNHSHHNMTICALSLYHWNTEKRKNLEQKFIFQLGTRSPHGINERFSFLIHVAIFPPMAQLLRPTIPLFTRTKGERSKRQLSKSFRW